MTIHLSALALEVFGSGVVGFFVFGFLALLSLADDHFLPIPFTRDKIHGGWKTVDVPEWILALAAILWVCSVLAVIVSIGIAIGVRFGK